MLYSLCVLVKASWERKETWALTGGIPHSHIYLLVSQFFALFAFSLYLYLWLSYHTLSFANHTLCFSTVIQERVFATIRTRLLKCLLLYLNISSPIHLKSPTQLLFTANHDENCRFRRQKERKGGKKWGAFGFQATVDAGCSRSCRVGSRVPMFLPSSPHSLPEEFDPPTSLNTSGFTLPSDTPSQHTVIESLYKTESHSFFLCLFIAEVALATKPFVL